MPNLHPAPPTIHCHIGIWDRTGEIILMRGPSGRSDLRSFSAVILPIDEYERLCADSESLRGKV